jgi:hypothetical protein
MSQVASIYQLASLFEKQAAVEFVPLECECGNKWEAIVPRAGKGGSIKSHSLICPKCGDRGFTDIDRPRRIELEPEKQAPDLPDAEKLDMQLSMPRHMQGLGDPVKEEFHRGQRVEYHGRPARVIDPLVHHQEEFGIKNPEKRLVMVHFDDTPVSYYNNQGNYKVVKEKDLRRI